MYSQQSRFSRDINASMLLQCLYESRFRRVPFHVYTVWIFFLPWLCGSPGGGGMMAVYQVIIYNPLLDMTITSTPTYIDWACFYKVIFSLLLLLTLLLTIP